MASKALAVIVGAGPGTGAAVGSAFAKKGFNVALLSRTQESLQKLAESIKAEGGSAAPFACDVTSQDSVKSAFSEIKKTFPSSPLKVAVFNSSSAFQMGPFLEMKAKDLESAFSVSVMGGFYFAQAALPELLAAKGGTLIFTGATAALRGGAKLGTFAAGKFALRAISQSLAREFGPQGVHVAHVIVDGLIDTKKVASFAGEAKEEGSRLNPASIANTYVYLHEQDPSCWTQELDIRPAKERF